MPLFKDDIKLVREAAMSCDAETAAKLEDLANRMQEGYNKHLAELLAEAHMMMERRR